MREKLQYAKTKDFLVDSDWDQQYTNVYHSRLKQLKPFIQTPTSWTKAAGVSRILNLKLSELSYVTGVVYRECKQKPNALKDVDKINHNEKPQHQFKYTTDEDEIFLEDEFGRMMLTGKHLNDYQLITGLVITVLGRQNKLGDFDVLDIVFPQIPPPSKIPPNPTSKIAFVSGFQLNGELSNTSLLLEFLAETSEIGMLIVAGNSIVAPEEELVGTRVMRQKRSPESLDQLDKLFASLAVTVPTVVMPGFSDPCSIAFPQPELSPALFQYSKSLIANGALTLETNPAKFTINNIEFVGSSGQPVYDACRYIAESENIELEHKLLEDTLQFGHIAPSAPDTLWSPPVKTEDPLTLLSCPNVLFSGNRSGFKSTNVNGVRVISIPEFKTTGQIVLLDLNTLETELVEMGINI